MDGGSGVQIDGSLLMGASTGTYRTVVLSYHWSEHEFRGSISLQCEFPFRFRAMTQVVGIYNADGSVTGELAYAAAKLTGRGSCELCDVTHGWNPFGRREWKIAMRQSDLDITFIHRDEALPEQLEAAGQLPSIITLGDDGWHAIMSADDIGHCNKNPQQLISQLRVRLDVTATE